MKITVKTPENPTEEFCDKIKNGFIKKFGDNISFEFEADDKIIGGFIAEVNGTVFDTSIRSKLDEIKRVITE